MAKTTDNKKTLETVLESFHLSKDNPHHMEIAQNYADRYNETRETERLIEEKEKQIERMKFFSFLDLGRTQEKLQTELNALEQLRAAQYIEAHAAYSECRLEQSLQKEKDVQDLLQKLDDKISVLQLDIDNKQKTLEEQQIKVEQLSGTDPRQAKRLESLNSVLSKSIEEDRMSLQALEKERPNIAKLLEDAQYTIKMLPVETETSRAQYELKSNLKQMEIMNKNLQKLEQEMNDKYKDLENFKKTDFLQFLPSYTKGQSSREEAYLEAQQKYNDYKAACYDMYKQVNQSANNYLEQFMEFAKIDVQRFNADWVISDVKKNEPDGWSKYLETNPNEDPSRLGMNGDVLKAVLLFEDARNLWREIDIDEVVQDYFENKEAKEKEVDIDSLTPIRTRNQEEHNLVPIRDRNDVETNYNNLVPIQDVNEIDTQDPLQQLR